MLIVITSIIISLSVLLTAFVNFVPNLQGVVNGDFQRRTYANANLYALQYGQLAIRAKTLVSPVSFTFAPRSANCAIVGSCPAPAATAGEYLTMENGIVKTRGYSVITYNKLSPTDPGPTLQVTPNITR